MNTRLQEALTRPGDSLVPMTVGRHTYGNPRVKAYYSAKEAKISIGAFCSIADEVTFLLGGNHDYRRWTTYPMNLLFEDSSLPWHESTKGGITIGNDVWIGYGATILDGSVIGDGAVIGACAVVAGVIPPCVIAAGNPCRPIKRRFTPEETERYLNSAWWTRSDDEIAQLCKTL
jgi:acetyltransferase-like isoleucine patch superfamily enzyme